MSQFFPPNPPNPPVPPRPNPGKGVPPPPPGVFQYVGARYVPVFAEPFQWQPNHAYEPLTIVGWNNNSYTSKQFVPAGINPDNSDYWVETGAYNQQIAELTTKVDGFDEEISQISEKAEQASQDAADAKAAVSNVPDFSQVTADISALKDQVGTPSTDTEPATGLEKKVEDAADKANDAMELAQTTADDFADLSADVNTNKTNIAANTAAINGLTTTATNLDTRITSAESNITAANADITAIKAEQVTQNTAISTNAADITLLKSQVGTAATEEAEATGLELKVKNNADAIAALQGDFDEVKAASDSATETVEELKEVVGDENSGLIKEFSDLKEAVESGESVEALAGRVGLLENDVGKAATADAEATGLHLEIDNLKDAVDGNTLAIGKAKTDEEAGTGLTGAVETLEGQVSELSTTLATTDTNLAALAEQVGKPANGEESATGLELKVANNTTEIASVKTDLETDEDRITALETQIGKPAEGEEPATGMEKRLSDLESQDAETANAVTALQEQVGTPATEDEPATGLELKIENVKTAAETNATAITAVENKNTEQDTAISGNTSAITALTTRVASLEESEPDMSAYLPLAGGTMSGAIQGGEESGTDSLILYKQQNFRSLSLSNSGDYLGIVARAQPVLSPTSSPVRVQGVDTPVQTTDAANKAYVDSVAATGQTGGPFLPLAGGTITGPIKQGNENIAVLQSTTAESGKPVLRLFTDPNNATVGSIRIDHGTYNTNDYQAMRIAGVLTPSQNNDAANKIYVDNNFLGKNGEQTVNGYFRFPTSGARELFHSDGGQMLAFYKNANPAQAVIMTSTDANGTIATPIRMTGADTPISDYDIPNKAYVDSVAGGVVTGTYTGNQGVSSTTKQTVSLGFRAKAVIIFPLGMNIASVDRSGTAVNLIDFYAAMTINGSAANDGTTTFLNITATGFQVANASTSAWTGTYLNRSGTTYMYIAFR